MTTTLATLIAACAPLVHPVTMRALATVESALNPFAISINYPERLARDGVELPALTRQPGSAREALVWSESFIRQGYTVSVGIAQINVERLGYLEERRLVRNMRELFDPCTNLRAAQAILLDCWERDAGRNAGRLSRTLSCFNSGDSTTGIRNGYVQRIARAAVPMRTPTGSPSRNPEIHSVDSIQ